jgi:tetratricopeptide (TPR) repeat protein
MRSTLFFLAALAVFCTTVAMPALAQTTGSRIKKTPDQPTVVLRFQEPSEIKRVRELLTAGNTAEAIDVATQFVKVSTTPDMIYAGNNALCVAYSAARDYDKAVTACDAAIDLRPTYWLALNSRGIAHLKSGRTDAALSDFRAALSDAPGDSPIAAMIQHNIDLLVPPAPDAGDHPE